MLLVFSTHPENDYTLLAQEFRQVQGAVFRYAQDASASHCAVISPEDHGLDRGRSMLRPYIGGFCW